MSARGAAAVLVLTIIGAATAASAQQCTRLSEADFINETIYRLRLRDAVNAPLTSPASEQISVVSPHAGEDAVPDVSFPALIGLALGTPVSETDTGAFTFNLTPFALVAARHPEVIERQSKYVEYEELRKVGLAVTLGGRGEAFDRDGDGVVDDPVESESLGDSVSGELRYRFRGSRDRRDPDKAKGYVEAVRADLQRVSAKFSAAATALATELAAQGAAGGFCEEQAAAFGREHAAKLDGLVRATSEYFNARDAALEKIDSAAVWTLVAGATERKTELGPDLWWAGIRGAGGLGPDQGWSVNLDYGVTETLIAGGEDVKRINFGLEFSTLFGRDRAKDGLRGSLSAAYEKLDGVEGVDDDGIARVTAKLSVPLTETLSLPLSVTWSNRKELLVDEEEIRGYVGFTFNFDSVLRNMLMDAP